MALVRSTNSFFILSLFLPFAPLRELPLLFLAPLQLCTRFFSS